MTKYTTKYVIFMMRKKKQSITEDNLNVEVTKDPGSSDRTKTYMVNVLPKKASLDLIWRSMAS